MDKRRRKVGGDTRSRQEERLDEALSETFPASDPIAAGAPTGTEPLSLPVDRKAPRIDAEDVAKVGRMKRGADRRG